MATGSTNALARSVSLSAPAEKE